MNFWVKRPRDSQGAKFGDHLDRIKASRKPKGGMGLGSAVMRSSLFRALSLGFLAPRPFGFGGLKIIGNEPKQAYNVIAQRGPVHVRGGGQICVCECCPFRDDDVLICPDKCH
jgi:hypothetical protein